MPYLLGKDAIRRTIPYLKKGKLILRKNVRVMTIHYNDEGEYNTGAKYDLISISLNNYLDQ